MLKYTSALGVLLLLSSAAFAGDKPTAPALDEMEQSILIKPSPEKLAKHNTLARSVNSANQQVDGDSDDEDEIKNKKSFGSTVKSESSGGFFSSIFNFIMSLFSW